MILRVAVQTHPFEPGAEYASLAEQLPVAGAFGCFIGKVRGGGGLLALTLEHYPVMTEMALSAAAHDAEQRWSLLGCTVIHRVGSLSVGEPIVLVLTAAGHRQDAMQATGFLIDWLKTDAPFWKRESFDDGTHRWVEAVCADAAARRRWDDQSTSQTVTK